MRQFWSDREGNVALVFALAAIPMVGVMGAAVDYAMASQYRADVQKALDATALALTKIMPADEATLNTVGNQYFQANLKQHDLQNLTLKVTSDVGVLNVTASGTYKVKMASIFGADTIDVGARSEAKWSMGKVEIALVLDQSLSMQTPDPARIQALRGATVNLINVLENASKKPGDAKVGIVAFDGMVNVGYTGANPPSWVRFDWWNNNYGTCNKSGGYNTRSACEGQNVCTKPQYTSKTSCQNNNGQWVQATWTPETTANWNGCVYDRNQNHDAEDTAATGNNTYYPAAKCYGDTAANGNGPPQAITALSEDWAALRTKATNLTPTGYTNITIGLAWGWHVLSPTGIYTEGADYGTENLTKYIILMTDGYNTKNIFMEPNACNTNGPICPTVDNRTELACENIKTAGIKIYTVRLINGNEELLRECASKTSMYYNAQNAAALSGIFNSIGSEIASLHLSK
jgi:Flp pilus assembly protein TadG